MMPVSAAGSGNLLGVLRVLADCDHHAARRSVVMARALRFSPDSKLALRQYQIGSNNIHIEVTSVQHCVLISGVT
jgi:hypothetical protein